MQPEWEKHNFTLTSDVVHFALFSWPVYRSVCRRRIVTDRDIRPAITRSAVRSALVRSGESIFPLSVRRPNCDASLLLTPPIANLTEMYLKLYVLTIYILLWRRDRSFNRIIWKIQQGPVQVLSVLAQHLHASAPREIHQVFGLSCIGLNSIFSSCVSEYGPVTQQ